MDTIFESKDLTVRKYPDGGLSVEVGALWRRTNHQHVTPEEGVRMVEVLAQHFGLSVHRPVEWPTYDHRVGVTIDVHAGLARLEFSPGCATGTDHNTQPGVGFECIASYVAAPEMSRDGLYHCGFGVISRTDVLRLRNLFAEFLNEHPVAATGTSA